MIVWAILIFWAPGVRSNHTAAIVNQTFDLGDDVTIKCFATKENIGNTWVWYKQSSGQVPQSIAISYTNLKNIEFMDDFKNGRFSILSDKETFHLKIKAVTKEDTGLYYCGIVFLNLIKFISGAHLMIKGTEPKDVSSQIPVANGIPFNNTDSSIQKSWNSVLQCFISFGVLFVIVIIILLADHCRCWRKRHRARSNHNHLSEYSEVIYTHPSNTCWNKVSLKSDFI